MKPQRNAPSEAHPVPDCRGGRHKLMKMENFKIGTRLYSGFLLKILLTLIIGIAALYQMERLGTLLDKI